MANTRGVLLAGKLTDSAGNPLASQSIALSYTPAGGALTSLGNVVTAADGTFSSTVQVPAPAPAPGDVFTATYAGVAGQDDPSTASTPATPITVKTTLTITATVQ